MKSELTLSDAQLATIAATLGTCILIGLERHMPPHDFVARHIRKVETSIQDLAKITGVQLDQRIRDAATRAWGAAMKTLEEELYAKTENAEAA